MATSIPSSCQHMVRCTSRCVRRSSTTRIAPSRTYATSRDDQRPRAKEIEELPAGFKLDELSSLAHEELRTHRELRELARKAAWEMPLLSKLSKPFTPPTLATPLRWRYTTYLGELHPAASKVVVEFSLRDLKDVTEEQKQTIRKIAGARWHSDTDIVKMSCESFETQAQNKRYLGETIAALIKEAKEGADKFEDVPLDMRVQAVREKKRNKQSIPVKFPKEWRLTEERRAALDAIPGRKTSQIQAPASDSAEEQRAYEEFRKAAFEQGQLVTEAWESGKGAPSGAEAIHATRGLDPQREEPVMELARQQLPEGKMGKKEMGQQPVQR